MSDEAKTATEVKIEETNAREKLKAETPKGNRAQRRDKGRRLTIADMRRWQMQAKWNQLMTPKKDGK